MKLVPEAEEKEKSNATGNDDRHIDTINDTSPAENTPAPTEKEHIVSATAGTILDTSQARFDEMMINDDCKSLVLCQICLMRVCMWLHFVLKSILDLVYLNNIHSILTPTYW